MKKALLVMLLWITILNGLHTVQAQNGWDKKADCTGGHRYAAAGFSIGNSGYLGTGVIAGTTVFGQDFWRWDQPTNKWTKIADYPGGVRCGAVGFSINGAGYVGLGTDGSSVQSDLWAYDTSTHSWSARARFPGTPRYNAFCFVVGDKAYIGDGSSGGPPYLNDAWVYDATNDTWNTISALPGTGRLVLGMFSIGNYGYVGGGYDSNGDCRNDLWRYDPSKDIWNQMTNIPGHGRDEPSGFTLNNMGYMGLGLDSSGTKMNDFYQYNPVGNTWAPIANLPDTSRQGAVSFSIGNYGYAATGDLLNDGTSTNSLWEYGPFCQVASGTVTSSRDSICDGSGITSHLIDNGSSGHIQWQSSVDGINFNQLTGDTTSSYTTPFTLSQTTQYRVMISGSNCNAFSDTVTVNILPSPIAAFTYTINGNQVTFNSIGSSGGVTSYSWDFGDSSTANIVNPVHTYKPVDTVSVCLTVYNGSNCSYTICKSLTLDLAAGLDNISSGSYFQLFPNPATTQINIAATGLAGEYQLEIYNELGQKIMQKQINIADKETLQLETGNLPAGIYQLCIFGNGTFSNKKFVELR